MKIREAIDRVRNEMAIHWVLKTSPDSKDLINFLRDIEDIITYVDKLEKAIVRHRMKGCKIGSELRELGLPYRAGNA